MVQPRDWRYPRATIAQIYENNDYGYVMHAGMLFMEFLFASGLHPKDLRGKKILDFGCGTGRVSRFLALTGAYVVGYDPTPECIEQSMIEAEKAPPTSLAPKLLTSDLSTVGKDFDIIVCINVLSHLDRENHNAAIEKIIKLLKENGSCYLWVHKNTHLPLLDTEEVRNQPTNVVIVQGIKNNGIVGSYKKIN